MKTKKYIFIAAAASMLGMTTSCDDEGFLTEKAEDNLHHRQLVRND